MTVVAEVAAVDYGAVVGPEAYAAGITEHPWITQADAGICRLLAAHAATRASLDWYHVLDLGCGAGRITPQLSAALAPYHTHHHRTKVLGLDESATFIREANARMDTRRFTYNYSYERGDFLVWSHQHQWEENFDAIVMQGVMHHVPARDRIAWFESLHRCLNRDGVIIVGDEFLPRYADTAERQRLAVRFYLYVIAEAARAQHDELMVMEMQNLIDDVTEGTRAFAMDHASHRYALREIALTLYDHCHYWGYHSEQVQRCLDDFLNVSLEQHSVPVTDGVSRGDYKISLQAFLDEMRLAGFTSYAKYEYGPVGYLGGMVVLGFVRHHV